MAEIIRMPKLSDTMVEGVVAEWHKKIGESVEEGELIAEIETDNADNAIIVGNDPLRIKFKKFFTIINIVILIHPY
jgi:hypothetical protein